jgi:NADH-quinone oxidoreductase subunit M
MGLPGFSGFIAEMQVLVGAWQAFPLFTMIAGVGILLGVAYTWRALLKAFYADDATPVPLPPTRLAPISIAERTGACVLLGTSLLIGLYPKLLLDLITPALNSPLMQPLWKGVTT